MAKLYFKTFIKCSAEDLFIFHTNTENIFKITPKNIKVKVLSQGEVYAGKIIEIDTWKFGIKTSWKVKVSKLVFPIKLVDEAIVSPFKHWVHRHEFIECEGGCYLIDEIDYTLPFGLLGKFLEPFLNFDLKHMFNYRHKETKKLLEK